MQSVRPAIILAACCLLTLVPAISRAQEPQEPRTSQEIILEADLGTESVAYCQNLHSMTCASVHVETQTALKVGASLQLDGATYVLTWMGPGYYLETGVVLEPLGDPAADLEGQRWVEIKPHLGRVHTSRGWKDRDGNRALSASDRLALDDGPDVEVKDVRLHLRVRPAAEKPASEKEK